MSTFDDPARRVVALRLAVAGLLGAAGVVTAVVVTRHDDHARTPMTSPTTAAATRAAAAPAAATSTVTAAPTIAIDSAATASSTAIRLSPRLPTFPRLLTLAEVPALLPNPLPASVLAPVRSSDDAPAPTNHLIQVYGTDGGGGWLTIDTSVGPGVDGTGTQIGPWTVTTTATGGGPASVRLTTTAVQVDLSSNLLGTHDLEQVAGRLVQLPDGSWDAGPLPGGLRPVTSGFEQTWTARRMVASNPQTGFRWAIEIVPDGPSSMRDALTNATQALVDVNGQVGVTYDEDTAFGHVRTVVWQYRPRIWVRFGIVGATRDQLLAAARSVAPVDLAVWNAYAPSRGDGCPTFWTC